MPALAPAGYTWLGDGAEPDRVVTFSDGDGSPIIATFWERGDATEAGLFPLGSGDDRLQRLPIIGHWKQQDRSLSSTGVLPDGLLRYDVPELPADYVADILMTGSYPISNHNQRIMLTQVAIMFKLKAYQLISSQDQLLGSRFIEEHDGASPQQVLEDLGSWDHDVVPYIQDIPGRIKGLLLENTAEGNAWKDLERY
ncbi:MULTISPECIES: hypothetical protein [unclassified Modestobacter]|uniref:hypothetical protein n=1 Tax=unclassified Modestobacter TaxID=2643866 RepID=UPI0022AAD02B|nr:MULTISPECIES: hypothetical protein [unclassified Modestobacter]MCZ2826091.1 hypothetical protein [Modestobacter sp. VKM Ac-2981]MCZ2852844.1 hypothetical protein [Modestobacter sp. VKM Ac-2982]